MLLIKVGLEESQIIGNLTPRLKYELKSSLSYQNQGQIIQRNIMKKKLGYIPKHLKWSGIIYLYNETKNTFPTGLLKKVKKIIESHGENWSEVIEYNIPQSHQCNIVSMGDKPLRFYQIDGIQAIKDNMRGIIRIGTGGGKALCLDTEVLTTTGYKKMRDINLQDEVITPEGKSKVIGIYPQGIQDVYRITFSDGTSTKSTLDHLWAVRSAKEKYKNKPYKIKSLKEILNIGLTRKNCPNSSQNFIPITQPIKNFESTNNLPIDPYLLGVLIGDGSLCHGLSFTNIDDEIIQSVKNLIPNGMKVSQIKNSISYRISNINPNSQKKNQIKKYLESKNLNVKSEFKFVPDEYLYASLENRVALLQGLLDTDGGIEMGRKVSFSTSSEQLAKDVQFLVQSLGGTAKISKRKTTHLPSYRMNLCLPNEIKPFRLSRKANQVKNRIKYFPRRAIKKVEYVGKEEVQCIKIEDSKGLFLINDCIVTHNTIMAINAAAEICQLPFLFVVNRVSLLKQAHKDFEKFLGEKIGFIGDGQMSFGRFNIATVHTLCSILNIDYNDDDTDEKTFTYTPEQIEILLALLKSTRMVVVDECHHAASDMYRKLMKNLPNAIYRIGLSATPFRTDGLDLLLTSAFGDVLYNISASELIRLKYLVKPYIRVVLYKDQELGEKFPTEQKPGKRKANYNTVYKECVVENQKFNTIVAKLAITHAKVNEQVLISVKQVTHGENILKIIKSIYPDAPVEFLHGKNKKELGDEAVIKRFSERETKILISTLFDEGVDIPAIDVAIDAGGGISPIKMLQLVGRAIRLNEGKERAIIYVFAQPYTHLMKHSVERINILKTEEEFVIEKLEWDK